MPSRILRRWGRNLLTVLALGLSFSMVLSLSSIALGLERAGSERMSDSPRDMVVSSLGILPSIENAHPTAEELDSDGENFSAVMPLLTLLGRLAFPREGAGPLPEGPAIVGLDMNDYDTETVGVVGVVPRMTRDFMDDDDTLVVRSERLKLDGWFKLEGDPFFVSGYSSDWTGEALLDRNLADEYGLGLGSSFLYMAPSGESAASFKVSGFISSSLAGGGLSSELLGGLVLLNLGELQFVSSYHRVDGVPPREDLCNAIYVDIAKDRSDPASQQEIALMLEKRFPGLQVTTKENRLYRIEEEVLVLQVFSVGVGYTTLLIGAMFLSSIMVMDVEDRKAEISIMRAIGISRRTIFFQIVGDSLLLSMLGAAAGLVPGYIGASALDRYLQDLYGVDMSFSHITAGLVLACTAFLMACVLVFSLVPAIKGTSMDVKKGMGSVWP